MKQTICYAAMRSPRTSTLLAVAFPLVVVGLAGIASCVGQDRSFFTPDAVMWSVNWPSYVCLITAGILLFFASGRAIFRSLNSRDGPLHRARSAK